MKKSACLLETLSLLLSFTFVSPCLAQEQAAPSISKVDASLNLNWQGIQGRTYFIQYSNDLLSWSYMPVIESGVGSPLGYEFDITGDRGLFRLRYTDTATSNPNTADFDNDGISNWDEIKTGGSKTDPLAAFTGGGGISDYYHDSDGNLLNDGWELKYNSSVGLIQPSGDEDFDGLSNSREEFLNSNPNDQDTDSDGLFDKVEDDNGTNILINEFLANPDTVGLNSFQKYGLRAVWGFQKRAPNQFLNSIGNNFPAYISGSVVRSGTASGPVSHTATFNNLSGYLSAPLNVTTDTGNGAVAFWFKGSPSNGERLIFSRDYGTYPIIFVSYITTNAVVTINGITSVQKVGVFGISSGVPYVNAPTRYITVNETNPAVLRIDDGKWHHVVISAVGKSTQLSIDGVSASAPQLAIYALFAQPPVGAPSNLTNESGFYFGAISAKYAALSAQNSLNATIDQVLIYNRAISKTEATALYNYDADGDSFTNIEELEAGTDPLYFDTETTNN